MNRLVIIGNGFDLAHGLPTSYKDFINDYWETACQANGEKKINYKDNLVTINCEFGYSTNHNEILAIGNINNFHDIDHFIKRNQHRQDGVFQLNFTNMFFKFICETSIDNWVDIENEYYRLLKVIAKHSSLNKQEKKDQIIDLNKEFEQVKNLLEKYLKEKVVEKYNFSISNINDLNKFHNIFSPDILEDSKIPKWKVDFSKKDKEYIDEIIKEGRQKDVKLRFLNFNYTSTIVSYFYMNMELYKTPFFIHGRIDDSMNKINFGFGDEKDEDYKMIENIDDNEYLKNFKSFQYLQNNIYKNLLDFVESERFEVFIMGSSCGLSDRTLLNTIFEHDNCRLIKVFYHQDGDKDNFTELVQNISRHFNDKKLMRSKIIHKSPEQIMPKIQLLKKQ